MKLVFSNCVLYNGAESEVGKVGINLGKEFDRLCVETGIDKYFKDKSDVKHEVKEEEKDHGHSKIEVEESAGNEDGKEDANAEDEVKQEVKEEDVEDEGNGEEHQEGEAQDAGSVGNENS